MDRKYGGKRRNCKHRAISPFPAMFSKELHCIHMKSRAFLGKGFFKRITLHTHEIQGFFGKGLITTRFQRGILKADNHLIMGKEKTNAGNQHCLHVYFDFF